MGRGRTGTLDQYLLSYSTPEKQITEMIPSPKISTQDNGINEPCIAEK